MPIRLRLFGELKRYMPAGAGARQTEVEVPAGLDVLGLIMHLGIPYEGDEGQIVVTINDTQVDHHASIREGDVVSMFEPLAGGVGG
jgi:molybdopterin converting factor small subunit